MLNGQAATSRLSSSRSTIRRSPTSGNLYSVSWNNINSGVYALTAKATDNANGTTTSTAVNVNVVAQTGLSPSADAYVPDGSSATTNFGTALTLHTQSSATAGNNRESYLKFDLTTVSGINKATVRLYGSLSDATGSNVPAGIYSVATTTWVESGSGSITWNNKPPAGATPPGAGRLDGASSGRPSVSTAGIPQPRIFHSRRE